jgi:endonuclease YncB( thermonuclease family)
MQHNEYDVKVIKVVDGDTVDVDIDLGFGVTLTDERVRIMGIEARLKELMKDGGKLITTEDRKGEDMKGKFGRVLGDFKVDYNGEMKKVTEIMTEEGHCVPYFGGSKEDTQAAHMVNRTRLLTEGVVTQEDYDKAVAKMAK